VAVTASETPLAKTLHPVQVTAAGVGIIIGAGIYVLIGEAAAESGGIVWLSFLLAAALCALTGLSYCELSAAYPTAAAEYEYSRRAFPEAVAFLTGWFMVTGLVVAAATVSLGFGRYLNQFVELDPRVAAVGLIAVLFLLGVSGIRQAGAAILVLSMVQVAGLLFVIVLGLGSLGDHSLTASNGAGGVIGGAALVFFAFIGFDEVITLGDETADPVRTVPRALLAALAISTVLYVLTAVATVSVLGADALGNSERPLADVVSEIAGARGADLVSGAALVSTTNTALLALTAASRMLYAMARQDAVPRWLGRVSKRRVPLPSVVTVSLLAVACLLAADLSLLARVTDLSVYLVFIAVNLAVIVLRVRDPGAARPFRTPGSFRGIPILPILGIVSVVTIAGGLTLDALMAGAALAVIGLGAGLVFDARSPLQRRRPTLGR
jgi:APA family basic amino acid/polyamine antiporter